MCPRGHCGSRASDRPVSASFFVEACSFFVFVLGMEAFLRTVDEAVPANSSAEIHRHKPTAISRGPSIVEVQVMLAYLEKQSYR